MKDPVEAVAHAFVWAVNLQDVEALTNLMTENHRFVDSLGGVVEGREKMRAAWTAYFRMVPDYEITVEETFSEGHVVVMLGVAQGTLVRDGQRRPENHWTTPAAFRAQIEDGLVAEWRVYADNEPIRKRMAESM